MQHLNKCRNDIFWNILQIYNKICHNLTAQTAIKQKALGVTLIIHNRHIINKWENLISAKEAGYYAPLVQAYKDRDMKRVNEPAKEMEEKHKK